MNFGLEYSTFVYPGYPSHVVERGGNGCGWTQPGATVRGAAASLAVLRSVQSKHIIESGLKGSTP